MLPHPQILIAPSGLGNLLQCKYLWTEARFSRCTRQKKADSLTFHSYLPTRLSIIYRCGDNFVFYNSHDTCMQMKTPFLYKVCCPFPIWRSKITWHQNALRSIVWEDPILPSYSTILPVTHRQGPLSVQVSWRNVLPFVFLTLSIQMKETFIGYLILPSSAF